MDQFIHSFMACIDSIRLDWIRLDWIGLDSTGLDWIGFVCLVFSIMIPFVSIPFDSISSHSIPSHLISSHLTSCLLCYLVIVQYYEVRHSIGVMIRLPPPPSLSDLALADIQLLCDQFSQLREVTYSGFLGQWSYERDSSSPLVPSFKFAFESSAFDSRIASEVIEDMHMSSRVGFGSTTETSEEKFVEGATEEELQQTK